MRIEMIHPARSSNKPQRGNLLTYSDLFMVSPTYQLIWLILTVREHPALCGGYHPLMFRSLGCRDIHTSVLVHYFLYSGRSEQRDGHSPDTVTSDTSVGRGSCDPKRTILLPSPLLFSNQNFVTVSGECPLLFFVFLGVGTQSVIQTKTLRNWTHKGENKTSFLHTFLSLSLREL